MDATVDRGPKTPESVKNIQTLSPQTLRHLGLIAGCEAAFHVLYQIGFKPCWSGDSYVYSNMFLLWSRHFYSTSYRPPVYALFLGFVQRLAGTPLAPSKMGAASLYSVVYLQCFLGLVAALAVYASLRLLDIHPRLALGGGLAFSLIGAVCISELLILTELLSLVLITLGSCLFLRAMRALRMRESFRGTALSSGLCFSLAILTRPENLVFFLVLVALVALLGVRCRFLVEVPSASRSLISLAVLLVVSAAPLVLLWMSFTLLNIGQFRLAIVTGVTRTEAVYNLFDRVDSQDRVAGELLQKSYRYTNYNGVTYRHHVWFAMPELEQAAHAGLLPIDFRERTPTNPHLIDLRHWLERNVGLHEHIVANGQVIFQPVDLYDYLGELSGNLERRYPTMYARNVLTNFFTDTFHYSYPPPSPTETENPQGPDGGSAVRSIALYELARWINDIETPFLSASYIVLLGFVFFSPVVFFAGREETVLRDGAVFTLAVAAFAVIVASCVVAAYYPEHGIAFFGVLVICVCFAVQNRERMKGRILAAIRSRQKSALAS
jgi:hypothetical protein